MSCQAVRLNSSCVSKWELQIGATDIAIRVGAQNEIDEKRLR